MEPIPDAWPRAAGSTIAPVFPLPGFFLWPGAMVPLHIFEPRYREMLEDQLDGPGRLVMGTVVEGHESELAGAPPLYPVAGYGEIGRHERLPDGRFNIVLVGIGRVRIREVASDRLYRKVEIEPLEEIPVAEDKQRALQAALHKAIMARCDEFLNLPALMPVSNLADLLIQRLELPSAAVARLFSEIHVETRARAALHAHAAQGPPAPDAKRSGGAASNPE